MNSPNIENAFEEYREACYGDKPLPPIQYRQVKQAFLSGIHWLNSLDNFNRNDIAKSVRNILTEENFLP